MVRKLVHNRHPFIVLRGNTYYFRFTLPSYLRRLCPSLPREAKRSLYTDSISEAVYLISQKLPLIKLLKMCIDDDEAKLLWGRLVDFSEVLGVSVGKKLKRLTELPVASDKTTMYGKVDLQKGPLLSEAWKDFVSWKSWNDKRTKDNQRVFDNLVHFLGDIPVGDVTKTDLKTALTSVSGLPQRNKKAYKNVSLPELAAMDIPDCDLVSGKYVKEHLKLAQGLFSSYLVREIGVLHTSPTEGLRWEHEDNRYASLTDAEVKQVIKSSETGPEWFQWFLKIAIYSGARRSEIASLRASDFKFCCDTNRYYFVIHKGKTQAARRMVPIHKSLVTMGLLKWVGSGSRLIFPIASVNLNRVTDNFNRLINEKHNDLGERKVFHSIRHTFITKARAKGVSNVIIQQVVGHEKSGAGMTDRYTHTFQLKDVLQAIDVVEYGWFK